MRVKCTYADDYRAERAPSCGCEVCGLKYERKLLSLRVERLESAAKNLRAAQKLYLEDRGNNEKGKAVGTAAKQLDAVLAGYL